MPNVTYIKINRLQNKWSSFTNTSSIAPGATSDLNNNHHNLTSDLILLIEEPKNTNRLLNGSSFAIAVVVCAFLTLLVGCCCVCNWYNQYPNSAVANTKKRQRQQRHQRLINNGWSASSFNSRNGVITAAALAATATRYNESQRSGSNNTTNTTATRTDHIDTSSSSSCSSGVNITFGEYFRDINNESTRSSRRTYRNNRSINVNNNNDRNGFYDDGRQEHQNDQPDIMRRFDLDVESLPSYTLVSGLPTYDDALEQIRKPGLLITTPNIMKLFDNFKQAELEQSAQSNDVENHQTPNSEQGTESQESNFNNSSPTLCTCEGSSSSSLPSLSSQILPTIMISPNCLDTNSSNGNSDIGGGGNVTQIIELGPDQLNMLSQRRLSVQIAFSTPSINRSQVNLTNLKSSVNGKLNVLSNNDFPMLHGRTPSLSVRHLQNRRASDFVRNSLYIKNLKRNAQHRGSLG